jgi:type I restriction enzyme R subunit
VLSKYIESGVGELDQEKLPHLLQLKYQALSDATAILGGTDRILSTFIDFPEASVSANGSSVISGFLLIVY